MKTRHLITMTIMLLVSACTTDVDSTERCIETRYGKVVNDDMGTGINFTPWTKATCFPTTEQNYPDDEGTAEKIAATTADPIDVTGEFSMTFVYARDAIPDLFNDKRTPENAMVEVRNAVREGYRNALAGWKVENIFSNRREELGDSIKAHIQRRLGGRATVVNVFPRDIKMPDKIVAARVDAASKAQLLAAALQQFAVDSVTASGKLMVARSEAEGKRLTAQAYETNPKLLELDVARAVAEGLAKACSGAAITTCILGGSAMDALSVRPGGR